MNRNLPLQTGSSLLTVAICLSVFFIGSASISQINTAEAGNYQKELTKLHNRERKKKNRPKLRLNSTLKKAAQAYAQSMAATGNFSHVGVDGSTVDKRIQAKGGGFSLMGENLAQGQLTAKDLHKGWMNSPAHKRNILNRRFRTVGFGVAGGETYWVANFGD